MNNLSIYNNREKIVINVASGKGGTGKTLLSAVLAELLSQNNLNVLLIDLDLFVRGLSALYYYCGNDESNILVERGTKAIVTLLRDEGGVENISLGISEFRKFFILPCVEKINEDIRYKELFLDNREKGISKLRRLLNLIDEDYFTKERAKGYDVVILDSRSGFDEFIAATHAISNITLCVNEIDQIAKITTTNLEAFLKEVDPAIPIYKVNNKVRGFDGIAILDAKKLEVTSLGNIPFDGDIMDNFGEKILLDKISNTLYATAIVEMWNRLCIKERFDARFRITDYKRNSAIGSERIDKSLGILDSKMRILYTYGILLAVLAFIYVALGNTFLQLIRNEPLRFIALLIGIFGLITALLSVVVSGKKKPKNTLQKK